MKLPTIYISPMSNEIINAVIELKNYGFVATRHQISNNGYVCDDNILIKTGVISERDHGQYDLEKYLKDAENDYKILHVDVMRDNFYSSIGKTIYFIEQIYSKYPDVLFEIGTEEKVFKYDYHMFDFMLYAIFKELDEKIHKNIKYAVIQSGAYVFNATNIDFKEDSFKKMIEICKKFNVLSKEHNCDFIDLDIMKKRINGGLDSYNIGPQIVYEQNRKIIENLDIKERKYIETYCYEKHEWEKWCDKMELIAPCTLHYYYKELGIDTGVDMKEIIKRLVL